MTARRQGDRSSAAETKAARSKFKKLLPPGRDLELIVLKGHLLIEEGLHALAAREIRYPRALREAKFGYYQILHVAKGLCYARDMDFAWQMMERLNSLRNTLAHDLDEVKFRERLEKFLEPLSESSETKPGADLETRLREALGILHLILTTYSNRAFDHGKPPNFHS